MKMITMWQCNVVPNLSLGFLNRSLKSAKKKYLGGLLNVCDYFSSQVSYSNRNKDWEKTKYLQ